MQMSQCGVEVCYTKRIETIWVEPNYIELKAPQIVM